MSSISTPRELFVHKLGDILYAEKTLAELLPTLVEDASDEELRSGLEAHLEQTRKQIENVEKVFELCGEQPQTEECPGIEGLRREYEKTKGEVEQPLMDMVVAQSAAATEHYEISAYEALVATARALGESDAVELLEQNQKQEKETAREWEQIGRRLGKEAAKDLAEA